MNLLDWLRRLRGPRKMPRELVVAETKKERVVAQADAAVDRALREIRRLERAPH